MIEWIDEQYSVCLASLRTEQGSVEKEQWIGRNAKSREQVMARHGMSWPEGPEGPERGKMLLRKIGG